MKLLQLNTWCGRLERQIPVLLKQELPDILCLQEVISFDGQTGMFLTLEDMQNISGCNYLAVAPKFSFNYMDGVVDFCNAILSRLPILRTEIAFTNLSYEEDFNFNTYRKVDMRNFVHAVIKIRGQSCHIITHHGHHIPDHKEGDAETTRQMKILEDYIDKLSGPVILAGDFNLSPHSKSLEQLNSKLINLCIENRLKTTRTFLTPKKEVCDYIFVNNEVDVKQFYASEEVVSDHKALILEFDV